MLGFAPISDYAISDNFFFSLTSSYEDASALVFFLTGASSEGAVQLEQALSLGGYRSSTYANRVGVLEQQACPNINIIDASHQIGIGNLTVLGNTSVIYSGPNAQTGDSVQPEVGTPITVVDSLNQWVLIERTTSNPLLGAGVAAFHEQFNNVFGGSNGTVSGESTYRGIIVRNNSLGTVSSITLTVNSLAETATCVEGLPASGAGTIYGNFDGWPWAGWLLISSTSEIAYYSGRTSFSLTVPSIGRGLLGTTAGAGSVGDTLTPIPPIRLALETPSSGHIQTIANETTSPTGLSFSNSVTISSLGANAEMGIWINRQIPNGMTAYPEFEVNIALQFTTGGLTYNDELVGLFRVSDSTLDRYEVSWALGGPPDLTQPPNATFTSFPFTTSYEFSDGTWYFSVNRRNTFNLVSENTNWTILNISGGVGINLPPSAPNFTVTANGDGSFTIAAYYYPLSDAVPADEFHFYVSFSGNPLGGSYTTVDMRDLASFNYCSLTTSSEPTGTTASVVVRSYRSSDGMESTNTTIETATSIETAFGTVPLKGFYLNVGQQCSP